MRAVVVGASSGLGRYIGIELARRGARTALLARRHDRLTAAAEEAGPGTLAIPCDVTQQHSCVKAVEDAAQGLGGIDALVYATGVGPLAPIEDLCAQTWRQTFDTNVIGASLVTAAALPYLKESSGNAVYLSSISASETPPWPGLGAYAVSKAALDKLTEAWRGEHPTVGFTRIAMGVCQGGDAGAHTSFTDGWDMELAARLYPIWADRNLFRGDFVAVDDLVRVVHSVLESGGATCFPSVVVTARSKDA
ncbi:SDR family NAD(P)-dependent oxidoreductase [Frankia sp. CNm7]|uniref:SDR family NAD(P)-dependent oxidoreductase n=1 Tax=Frankia nepalensis TaxID=1836974 RepID=A0A937RKR7_9ACTN|nr:SDR family NAD(P)-dependent oxidoreductase [Frankia nepalensis]MBL7499172.1 SDR family NAD(P)-dependent oxidoreductase [Frankia nepalensis]MBL7511010.1 SDR family NAD(P)-dependent oxidoreductase [Frankia nepalensis]MBL7520522.1 SDR family NAD(P)-dependent oxidoreductase [Frankia nepalensis]MBL7632090.1 SDR family NAD(P)-dependent oxidoreductase [Frankia nepalensis]